MTDLRIPLYQIVSSAALAVSVGAATAPAVAAWFAQVGAAVSDRFGDLRPRLPGALRPATACAAADLDGDGLCDLVRAAGAEVVVLIQRTDGRFLALADQAHMTFPNRGEIIAIAPGRFDGDPHLDLVVGLSAGPDVLLVNDGTGRFSAVPSPFPPRLPTATQALVAGDFDGNRVDELVLLASSFPPVLLASDGRSPPTFSDQSFRLPAGLGVRSSAAAADFDGDGALDLLMASSNLAVPIVLFNSGAGSFQNGLVNLPTGPLRVSRAVAHEMTGDNAPDAVLGVSADGTRAPILLRYAGRQSFAVVPQVSFNIDGLTDLIAVDLTRDAVGELVAIQGDGSVVLGVNNGSGNLAQARPILRAAPRCCACAADLEPDGDRDLYVPGRDIADSLLLGRGDGELADTEAATAPIASVARPYDVAMVDTTGEGDPDLVLIDSEGAARVIAQDGGVRFSRELPNTVRGLPQGHNYRQVEVGSIAGSGRDLFVLGQQGPGNAHGIRLLFWDGANLVDQTVLRWRIPPSARLLTAFAVAPFGRTAPGDPTDIVLGDSAGNLDLYRVTRGTYSLAPGAFPAAGLAPIQRILVGEVTGDALTDVVVIPSLGTPRLYVGVTATSFRLAPVSAIPLPVASRDGVLEDVDGDGPLDLLFVTPASPNGFSFLQNAGGGAFADVTNQWFGATRLVGVVAVAVQGDLAERSIVFARLAERDVVVHRSGARFAAPLALPVRGGIRTRRVRVCDLDSDGDEDLVLVRQGVAPAVLFDLGLQLGQVGAARIGATSHLAMTLEPGVSGLVFFSPLTTRFPLPPFGILRLVNPVSIFAATVPPSGRLELAIPIPGSLSPRGIPLQGASFDPSSTALSISNLEQLHVDLY